MTLATIRCSTSANCLGRLKMNELLGFIVLSGPFLPALVWLIISIVLVTVAIHPTGRLSRRISIRLLAFVIVLLLPFIDEIVGRLYLTYLCDTQGGFKVYETVKLPDKYWDENGEPRFIKHTKFVNPSLNKVNGTLDTKVLTEYGIGSEDVNYSSMFGIRLFRHWYYEKATGKTLAEGRFFAYKQGWLARTFSVNSGVSCNTSGQPNTKANILSVFVPERQFKQ